MSTRSKGPLGLNEGLEFRTVAVGPSTVVPGLDEAYARSVADVARFTPTAR
jgi:hypothetical protein